MKKYIRPITLTTIAILLVMAIGFSIGYKFASPEKLPNNLWRLEKDTTITGDKDKAIKDIVTEMGKVTAKLQLDEALLSTINFKGECIDTAKFNQIVKQNFKKP